MSKSTSKSHRFFSSQSPYTVVIKISHDFKTGFVRKSSGSITFWDVANRNPEDKDRIFQDVFGEVHEVDSDTIAETHCSKVSAAKSFKELLFEEFEGEKETISNIIEKITHDESNYFKEVRSKTTFNKYFKKEGESSAMLPPEERIEFLNLLFDIFDELK